MTFHSVPRKRCLVLSLFLSDELKYIIAGVCGWVFIAETGFDDNENN